MGRQPVMPRRMASSMTVKAGFCRSSQNTEWGFRASWATLGPAGQKG